MEENVEMGGRKSTYFSHLHLNALKDVGKKIFYLSLLALVFDRHLDGQKGTTK